MSSPEQGRPNIDQEQRRLDGLDGATDGKFADEEALQKTYGDRVNDAQAQIRRLRTQASTLKDAKQDGWQEMEAACDEQEKKLFDILQTIVTPAQLREARQSVEKQVSATIDSLSTAQPEGATENTDVRRKLEAAADAFHARTVEVQRLEKDIRDAIALLAKDTADYSKTWFQNAQSAGIIRQRIERIGRLQVALKTAQAAMAKVGAEVVGGEIAVLHADAETAFANGNRSAGNRLLLRIWERHGSSVDLERTNPQLAKKISQAIGELRAAGELTEFEQRFFREDVSYDELLKLAVQEHRKMEAATAQDADIVDQLKSGGRVKIEVYKIPRDIPNNVALYGGYRTVTTQNGEVFQGVAFSNEALAIIDKNPRDVVFLKKPFSMQASPERGIERAAYIDVQDLAYAHLEENDTRLVVQDPRTNRQLRTANVGNLERDRDERVNDIVRCLDRDPAMASLLGQASDIHRGCETVQTLFAGGMQGGKYEQFVEFSRNGANQLLQALSNPQTLQSATAARERLRELKGVQLGVALGGLEGELDRRIQALDTFIAVLKNTELRTAIDTMRDKSQWSADTWSNWCTKEGPRILAAIAVAVVATATIILTCGAATPMWAVAAAGAAGGMAGAEIAKEVQYSIAQYDKDIAEGRATYKDRSKLGAYVEGQTVRDPVTGEERERTLMDDVISPYAQEFAVSFGTTLVTLGASQAAGSGISNFLNNGRVLQALNKHAPTLNKVILRMQRLEQAAGGGERAKSIQEFVKRLASQLPGEIREEMTDELVEQSTDQFLTALQTSLGQAESGMGWGDAAAFVVGTVQNIRIRRPGVMTYRPNTGVDVQQAAADLRTSLEAKQYVVQIDSTNPAVLLVTNASGSESFRVEPDTTVEGPADTQQSSKQLSEADLKMKETIMNLPDTEEGYAKRIEAAEYLLKIELSDAQKTAIRAAHDVPMAGDNYSLAELRQKMEILEDAGFTRAQADRLLRMGVCGRPPAINQPTASPEGAAIDWRGKHYALTNPTTGRRDIYVIKSRTPNVVLERAYGAPEIINIVAGSPEAAAFRPQNIDAIAVQPGDVVCIPQFSGSGEDMCKVTGFDAKGRPVANSIRGSGRQVTLYPGTFYLETNVAAKPEPADVPSPMRIQRVDSLPTMTGAAVRLTKIDGTFEIAGSIRSEVRVGQPVVVRTADGGDTITSKVTEILLSSDGRRMIVTQNGSRYLFNAASEAAATADTVSPPGDESQRPDTIPMLPIAPNVQVRLQQRSGGQALEIIGTIGYGIRVGSPMQIREANGSTTTTSPVVEILALGDRRMIVTKSGSRYEITAVDGGPIPSVNAGQNDTTDTSNTEPLRADMAGFYFSGNIEQANVGNCYLIAAFNSLYQHPRFDEMINTSMQQLDSNTWTVSFPLGSKNPQQTITVTRDNLLFRSEAGQNGAARRSVEGLLGWAILEAAYLKKKTGTMDRTRMEGGYGHEALAEMFGDDVKPFTGFLTAGIPLAKQLGRVPPDMSDDYLHAKVQRDIFKFLDKFDPRKVIATVNSTRTSSGRDTESYSVMSQNGPVNIWHNHAYSVESVNRATRTVTVKNPHDTSEALIFSYEDFLVAFSEMSAVTLPQELQ